MVRVSRTHPSLRAVIAGSARSKKNPNVAAIPGTGTLQGGGHTQLLASLKESQGVIFPSLLVEVCSEEPARFVWQEGYTPTVSLPRRWFSTTASVIGRNLRVLWSTLFRSSGRLLLMAFQSFTAAGAYPCRPSSFSHRRA